MVEFVSNLLVKLLYFFFKLPFFFISITSALCLKKYSLRDDFFLYVIFKANLKVLTSLPPACTTGSRCFPLFFLLHVSHFIRLFLVVEIYLNAKTRRCQRHSCSWNLGQILQVIMFAWKMVAEMAENWDVGRGPPNITNSGSLETVGSGILI